ncbi:MAG: hypothetical protein R3C10_04265 [Pirellulales bacterium]
MPTLKRTPPLSDAKPSSNRQRIIDHGEVFTPPGLVNDMLDLVQHECERIESRFLEPACGDGNFLTEVLRRKLATVNKRNAKSRDRWQRDAVIAVTSLYGIDLLGDNVAACRERLRVVVDEAHQATFGEPLPEAVTAAIAFILTLNVVQGDALSFLSADGGPIVFPEWSPVNGQMLKRRDFRFDHLLEHQRMKSLPLFSDLGEEVCLPEPVRDYRACHYLQVADAIPDEGGTK